MLDARPTLPRALRGRPARRASLALLLGTSLLPAVLQVAGCTSEEPKSNQGVSIDAGSANTCVLGTRACGCTTSGGCDPGLLCNTGRCYPAEGTNNEPEDPVALPPMPAPVIQPASASTPDASTDSGPSSNG